MANPAKSTKEKIITGTLQRVRITDKLSYDSLNDVPDPLEELDKKSSRYYYYICEVLLSSGLLTSADIPAITQAAILYGIFSDAYTELKEKGYYYETTSGYTGKNAHLQAMNDSYKNVKQFENLYGFNVSARGKINIPQKKEINPLDEI